jgi:hypothetical protein
MIIIVEIVTEGAPSSNYDELGLFGAGSEAIQENRYCAWTPREKAELQIVECSIVTLPTARRTCSSPFETKKAGKNRSPLHVESLSQSAL